VPAPLLDERAVATFLATRFASVASVEHLADGQWSRAFGFQAAHRQLVVRFGNQVEDYEKDLQAAAWAAPGLPIPGVLEIGSALGGVYAVSERVSGTPVDGLEPHQYPAALDSLFDALEAIRQIDLPGKGFGIWRAPDGVASHRSWSQFLVAVGERDDDRIRGWRERLSSDPKASAVFDLARRCLEQQVSVCPDLRGVIHGDLLAGNVLVDGDRISGIIDWGNSMAGDPLYDVAWLTFWAPWHPGLDPDLVRALATERFDEPRLAERLSCYELHIALDGLQYQAFAERWDDLAETTARTLALLG
jgi:hygromycin-B 4-O-kinase